MPSCPGPSDVWFSTSSDEQGLNSAQLGGIPSKPLPDSEAGLSPQQSPFFVLAGESSLIQAGGCLEFPAETPKLSNSLLAEIPS